MQTWLAETTGTASHTTLKARGGRFTTPAGPPPSHVPAAMYICICICIGYRGRGDDCAHVVMLLALQPRVLGARVTPWKRRHGPRPVWRPRSERCSGSGVRVLRRIRASKPGQPLMRRPARSGTQLRCRQRAPARGGTWNRSRSYHTRRGIRVRARARGGGGRARPSWAPCDGAGGRRRGRRAFAAAATALAAPPLSSPWTYAAVTAEAAVVANTERVS